MLKVIQQPATVPGHTTGAAVDLYPVFGIVVKALSRWFL